MIGGEYIRPTVVTAAVLPGRAVYLVAEESREGFRRAVQEACTRWGGMTEPIVPVKPGGEISEWFGQLVSLLRVDCAVNVDANPQDAAVAAGKMGMSLVPLADIDRNGLAAFTVHPSAVGPAQAPGFNSYVIASQGHRLWEVAGAGDLADRHIRSIPAGVLDVRRPGEDEVARAQVADRTLVERTCSQFGEHWTRGVSGGSAVIWVTEPDSFEDCVYFWNLRALRPLRLGSVPMLLIPAGQIQNWLNFPAEVGYALERPTCARPDAILRSLSVSEEELHRTAELLSLERYAGDPKMDFGQVAPIRRPPYSYAVGVDPRRWLRFERSYGAIADVDVQLFRDTTTVRFGSPVSFSGDGTALVRLSGAALEDLPRRPAIAERVIKGGAWRYDALQITALATNDYLFEIHVPELPEVTDALLSSTVSRHELSAGKGRPGMAWLEQADVAVLAQPGVYAAIRELTTPRSKELLRELRKLRADGAVDDELAEMAAHWGGRAVRRYRSAGELQTVPREDAAAALERLCGAGWAERGLRIDCGACGLPSFVPLNEASGQPACPGCASQASYKRGTALTVFYRISSHLDHLSDQGVLPHLLAIAALQRQGKRSYFLPGAELWLDADGSDRAEVDIFGVGGGRILSGEVKTSASEFTTEQLARDVSLSVRLQAGAHILAAIDEIPAEARDTAARLCSANGLELIVLAKADMLPGG